MKTATRKLGNWMNPSEFLTGERFDREWVDNPSRVVAYALYRTLDYENDMRNRYPALFASSWRRPEFLQTLVYHNILDRVDPYNYPPTKMSFDVDGIERLLSQARFAPVVNRTGWELGDVTSFIQSMYGLVRTSTPHRVMEPRYYTALQDWDFDDGEADEYWDGLTSLEYNWDYDVKDAFSRAFSRARSGGGQDV